MLVLNDPPAAPVSSSMARTRAPRAGRSHCAYAGQEGHREQALVRIWNTTYLQGECSYRLEDEKENGEKEEEEMEEEEEI
jgi:hypothetical protein